MSVTATAKRPARLDIQDMPRDPQRSLGGLRQALCAAFNYCRAYEQKMAVFVEVLEYTLARAKEYGSPEAADAIKDNLAAQRKLKLDLLLEERKSVITAATKNIKDVAQADLKHAQSLTVFDELKEYIITTGYAVTGETIEDVLAAFIKDRTAKYKADGKAATEAVVEQYAERLASFDATETPDEAA